VPIDIPDGFDLDGLGGIPMPELVMDTVIVYPVTAGTDASGGPTAVEGAGVTLSAMVGPKGQSRRDERHGTVESDAGFTVSLGANDPAATGLDFRDIATDWRVAWTVASGVTLSTPIELTALGPARPASGAWELDCRRVG
jgi:hypothetical protein